MKNILSIGIGGALGTMARCTVQAAFFSAPDNRAFLAMFVNISGSFLLGLAFAYFAKKTVKPEIKLGITTGFLGGYTSFSTLCKESIGFYLSDDPVSFIGYLAFSVFLGFGAAWSGMRTAKQFLFLEDAE
ncbi:fluoride efflux transporter FluC [Caproiciproducens faecalis]|uniref:Fluoride-specific ion channel FluC n=1 Tax=Caproiciproducens faecalis TaxID=2820301 RepID=A0ABS7DRN1_9FIRM|nr:CrcB family protein [Caproiciproducens faecalis]MBW7573848.1 CrcB family protein [Caproiciproducens faecalis]